MKTSTALEIFVFVTVMAVMLFIGSAIFSQNKAKTECTARGGVWLPRDYVCVHRDAIIPLERT